MRTKKVIFFDLWGTLSPGLSSSPPSLIKERLELDSDAKKKIKTLVYGSKFTNFDTFLRSLSKTIGKNLNSREINIIQEIIKSGRENVQKYPDTIKCLKTLKEAGFKLGVISNTWQFSINAVMNKTIIPDYIDDFIFSFDTGYIKPSTQIYDIAMEKFGIRPVDAVMVGDSYEEDIKGAQKAGLKTYWIRREDSLRKEDNKFLSKNMSPIINSLNELSSVFVG